MEFDKAQNHDYDWENEEGKVGVVENGLEFSEVKVSDLGFLLGNDCENVLANKDNDDDESRGFVEADKSLGKVRRGEAELVRVIPHDSDAGKDAEKGESLEDSVNDERSAKKIV